MYKTTRKGIYEQQDHKALLAELEEWRKISGLSKAKLAKRLGLRSSVTIYYWNKGMAKPYPRHLYRIIQILGKPITVEEYNEWRKERIK